jgi:hypothetical protein
MKFPKTFYNNEVRSYVGFREFIIERFQIYVRKTAGLKRSCWTKDPVLFKYKFCNINREHDTVTKWIDTNIRKPLAKSSKSQMILNLFLARVFNHPPTLEQLGIVSVLESDLLKAAKRLQEWKDKGNKIMRGAYMMGAHGSKGKGKQVVAYFLTNALGLVQRADELDKTTRLDEVAHIIMELEGAGKFLANQVITDLRYTRQYELADDWWATLYCGPGTIRGSHHAMGLPMNPRMTAERAYTIVFDLRAKLISDPKIKESIPLLASLEDPNNTANSLCEFDKYVRGVEILNRDGMFAGTTLKSYKNHPQ